MRCVAGHDALDALGVPEAEQERGEAAPVVSDQLHPVEVQRVEQRDDVGGKRLRVVPPARGVAPAEAAQVRHHEPELSAQRRDELAPAVPVLRPAVQQQQRISLAGLGHVHAQVGEIHPAVLYPLD